MISFSLIEGKGHGCIKDSHYVVCTISFQCYIYIEGNLASPVNYILLDISFYHIILVLHSCYENARLSYAFCVSGADVALYCANNFHRVLVNDGDYKDNLDVALKRAFAR